MRIGYRGIGLLMFASLCAACAATPQLTANTPFRIYDSAPDAVFAASVAAFQNLGLELFKQDKVAGYVEGGRKPAFAQGAETVGVFIKAESSGRTKVLIDNNKALAGVMFAVDWTENLFQQIGAELSKRPPPKIQ